MPPSPDEVPAHPPRPRLALRVGVTGHRLERLASLTGGDLTPLARQLELVLGRIHDTVIGVAERDDLATFYEPWGSGEGDDSSGPGRPRDPAMWYRLTLITCLAEGADQIAARKALDWRYRLEVVLPADETAYVAGMDPEPYRTGHAPRSGYFDLSEAASGRTVLDGDIEDGKPTPGAYREAGRTVVRHCDLLIAVWDGKEATALGGTADTVYFAASRGMPVIWIDPARPDSACFVRVRERRPIPSATPLIGELEEQVREILSPPPDRRERPDDRRRDDLVTYLREVRHRGYGTGIFFAATRLFAGEFRALARGLMGPRWLPDDYAEDARARWARDCASPTPLPPPVAGSLGDAVMPYYGWADNLANFHAARHRNGFTWTYLLAPFAVGFAAAGIAAQFSPTMQQVCGITTTEDQRHWLLRFAAGECVTLVLILAIFWISRTSQHHRKWIDYRLLAEQLRSLSWLRPIGRALPPTAVPPHLWAEDLWFSWVDWYTRAVARQVGLVSVEFSAAYRSQYRSWLAARQMHGQVEYHAHNAHRMHWAHKVVHGLSTVFFIVALALAGLHLFALWFGHDEAGPGGMTQLALEFFLPTVLPAFGAAMHGFSVQADFEGTSRRSLGLGSAMWRRIAELLGEFPTSDPEPQELEQAARTEPAELAARLASREVPTGAALGDLAEWVADVMNQEVIDWRVAYHSRPPTTPA